MSNSKQNNYFFYSRDSVRITGSSDKDRKSAHIDIILHWTCKIIMAIGFVIAVLY